MKNVVRTIYGMYLQSVKLRNSNFVLEPNTTLNEKFLVGNNETLPIGASPVINCYCIGNGGHKVITGSNSNISGNEVYHETNHAALYKHLPFISRPVTNDLSIAEASKYRLKVKTTINSTDYFFYYLKVINNLTDSIPNMVNVYTRNNNIVASKYESVLSNLSPVPSNAPSIDIPNHTTYLSVIDSIPFNLSILEITEIINAYQLLYGVTTVPIISEIGICSSIDKQILDFNNVTYTEALAIQINYFINTYYLTQTYLDNIQELNTFIEIGGLELMAKY